MKQAKTALVCVGSVLLAAASTGFDDSGEGARSAVALMTRRHPPVVGDPAAGRGAGEADGQPPTMALVGGRIYPSPTETPIPDGVVLVREGKIAEVGATGTVAIPPGTTTLDCRGLVVTAGFWNTHVHFLQRKWMAASLIAPRELTGQIQDMLTRYGFTTVVDTGSIWQNTRLIRDRIRSGEVDGPRILSSGEIILPEGGGFPSEVMRALGFMPFQFPEVGTPLEASRLTRQRLAAGVDVIKIYAGTWMGPDIVMPRDVVRAIVGEAHRRDRLVLAHPSTAEGLRAAVEGGADVLVHTAPVSGEWDASLVEEMKRRDVALIPTLKLWTYETRHDRPSLVRSFIEAGIDQTRAFHRAGGAILFGTDVGYMDDYDPRDEFVLLARAGLDFRQMLAALTTTPARRFLGGAARTGELSPGMDADLVVLLGDPAKEVQAFSRVRYTVRSGRIVYERPSRERCGKGEDAAAP